MKTKFQLLSKKLFFSLLILFTLTNQASACLCASFITSSYSEFSSYVKAWLQTSLTSLKLLNASLKTNTSNLALSNTLLNKQNALLKKTLLDEKHLLFLLHKNNELK